MGSDDVGKTCRHRLEELDTLSRRISEAAANPALHGSLKDYSEQLTQIVLSIKQSEEKGSLADTESEDLLRQTRRELLDAQRLLQQSEEKFLKTFNLGPAITTLSTADEGRYVEVSDHFLTTSEYSRDEVIGRTSRELGIWVRPEDRERVMKALKEAGRVVDEEILFKSRSGRVYTMLFFAELFLLGDVAYLVSVAIDMTERKRVEETLHDSEEKYRQLTESTQDVIVSVDFDFTITFANKAALGLAEGVDLVGKCLLDYTSPDLHELQKAIMQKRREGFSDTLAFEWNITLFDGMARTFDIRATLLTADGRPSGVLFVARDITSRRQAEDALKASENMIRSLVDSSPVSIQLLDREGYTIRTNEAFNKLFGSEPPADYTVLDDAVLQKLGLQEDMMRVARGETVSFREVCYNPHDLSPHLPDNPVWIHTVGFPLFDREGTVMNMALMHEDITERKRAEEERERLQAQLAQAQKMEAIGTLAGGVAHDFNNMLSVILGRTEMALEQIDPTEPLADDLVEIRKAAERSADITRQLLAFARKQTVAPKVLDLNETVEKMLRMLHRLIGENIELEWLPGDGLGPIRMDPSQLDQILTNLCINARDAITGVGRLTIETTSVLVDESYCAQHPEFVPGEYVMLAVSDTGCGMERETLAHIFDPFFTTKDVGKGTGLGLAMVYGIVTQNMGFITVESEPGRGTRFTIYLPRHEGKVEQLRKGGDTEASAVLHKETILLVEDEPAILEMVTRMLERQGYTVLAASSPGAGIRMAESHPGTIELLMTDVVMPEMNGRDLARNLISLYPNMKRLFMSGYTANVIAHHGVLDPGVHFIQKPFSMKELVARVRDALNQD